ncbi:phospho-acceptor domain-containing protein [Desulfobotulus alkaliphilus]|uniref:histidine kinase n=1 Tax=Desulfobotulus alkaliphilus TaxID=622671 RepID=A0A562RZ34_9BACT|nr:ATP-binding protein [Desulfobotulus alkaliphilus]TWI74123.1 phospho-acceptor domain-containing protein [Desulfobotulus alkaliphilus]
MNSFKLISAPEPPSSLKKTSPRQSFTLVKYFTLSSLILMFSGAIILSTLHTHLVRNLLIEKSEEYGNLLIENLNHQIFMQFLIPVYFQFGQIQLKDPEQFQRMDNVVRNTLHSFQADMVNIYDLDNVISYSFNTEIIGEKNLGGAGYEKAMQGESTTSFIQIGNQWEMLFRIPRVTRITTFAPLRMEDTTSSLSGPIIGVVEIVQNVSEDYKKIFRLQLLVIMTSSLVMGFLFLILRSIVKHGERILEERNEEQLRLKEEVNRNRHLSALGEMTAAISHEIRNPLGIIRSSAELLQTKMNRLEPGNTIADIIVEESTRMNAIITDFLTYARPRSMSPGPCNVFDILNKNKLFLSNELKYGHFDLHIYCAPKVPGIIADPDMLYQAFLNLILNAMQAMPDGGKINISILNGPGSIHILFEDRGPGIQEHILDKIREPFFTTKEKGTGLGLGIVEKIIAAHGGKMEISNRQEGGVRVKISLPSTESAETA